MTCKRCEEYRKEHPLYAAGTCEVCNDATSDQIECAFEHGYEFSTNNWYCQTMRAMRDLIGAETDAAWAGTWLLHGDGRYVLLPIPYTGMNNALQNGVLVLSWYNWRGRTGRAIVLYDDDPPETLTLQTAEFILQKYEEQKR